MQILVSVVSAGSFKEVLVQHIANRALVRHSQLHAAVCIVQSLSSDSLEVNEVSNCVALNRLTAAVDTAAGTSHDLNELVISLAGEYAVDDLSCVSKTGSNCYLYGNAAYCVGSFLQTLCTSYIVELQRLALAVQLNSCGSESSLHNAACCAEDSACTGSDLERIVELLVRQSIEVDTSFSDHSAQLTGCECNINVIIIAVSLLFSCYLELLSSTRDNADYEQVLGIDAVLLAVVALEQCAEHLLRRLTARQMRQEIRIEVLTELYPTGAARCEHRQSALVLDPLDQLVSFFHDREVGSNVHVEDVNVAQSSDSSDHLALNVSTNRVAELFAQSSSDRRSGEEYDLLLGICDSVPNLLLAALLGKSANRAGYDTLTAAYASGRCQRHIECGTNVNVETSSYVADNGNALYILTSSNASHTLDALVVISYEERSGVIDRLVHFLGHESVLICAVSNAELLQLAVVSSYAGETLLLVV